MISKTGFGRAAGLTAIALMAFGPIIIKVSELEEFRFIFWRLLLALVAYFLVLSLLGSRVTWSALRTSFTGGLCFVLQIVFFFLALRRTSAAHVTVVMALQPLVLLLVARVRLGERPRPGFYVWSSFAVMGALLTISHEGEGSGASIGGDVLALVGMLILCAYFVLSKRARDKLDSATYQICLTLVALIVIIPMVAISGHGFAAPRNAEWWPVVAMAAIPGTGHLLLNFSHRHVDLSEIGLINLLFTVLVPLYAWWLISESITWLMGVGIAVTIGAVFKLVTQPDGAAKVRG